MPELASQRRGREGKRNKEKKNREKEKVENVYKGTCETLTLPFSCRYGNRRAAVRAPGLRKDADCQGDGEGGGISFHQLATEHADGQMVWRVSETGCCCLLIGCETAAVYHLCRRDR